MPYQQNVNAPPQMGPGYYGAQPAGMPTQADYAQAPPMPQQFNTGSAGNTGCTGCYGGQTGYPQGSMPPQYDMGGYPSVGSSAGYPGMSAGYGSMPGYFGGAAPSYGMGAPYGYGGMGKGCSGGSPMFNQQVYG